MTRRSYKKPHRAKKRKPFLAKAWFWRAIFGVAAGGGLVWLVCFSPALEVKEITVSGAKNVNSNDCAKLIQDEVNKKIALLDSKSILLFNLDQARQDILARFPQIGDIKIERQFPSKIYASIQERQGVAVFNGGAIKFLVDDNGIAFEEAAGSENLLEISNSHEQELKLGGQALPKDVLSGILRMAGGINGLNGIAAVAAVIATPERINIQTKEGWYVYFDPLKDVDSQLSKLAAVIGDDAFKSKKANLEYVDVRFTRVYLKEKSADDPQSIPTAAPDNPKTSN
jgi:cell division septal protein FtsQ